MPLDDEAPFSHNAGNTNMKAEFAADLVEFVAEQSDS
jgi:hypothetical protein